MATDASAPLPDLDWPEGAIVTVDSGDAAANVTTLVIHLSEDTPEAVLEQITVTPIFVPGPITFNPSTIGGPSET